LLGFAMEQAIAWRFGAGAAVDAYVAALVIPAIISGVVGGALSTAFLPVYSEWRNCRLSNTRRPRRARRQKGLCRSLSGQPAGLAALTGPRFGRSLGVARANRAPFTPCKTR